MSRAKGAASISAPERDYVDQAVEDLGRELTRLDTESLEVGERILRIAGALRRRLDNALAPTQVKSAGFGVLAALRRAGKPYELKPSELSRATLLTSGAMTNRIDRLERAGLVERRGQSGTDRRTVVIGLTPAGKRLVEAAYSIYAAEVRHVLHPLSRRDTQMVASGLRKVARELGDTGDPARA